MARRIPSDLICCSISTAPVGSVITVLSVISNFKASGGRASSFSNFLMSSTRFGCRNCLAERLTLIVRWRLASEPALHSLICRQASRKFHQPSSRMRPVSSATGLAQRLSPVHGRIGIPQDVLWIFVGGGAQRDSDAHRGEHLFPSQ